MYSIEKLVRSKPGAPENSTVDRPLEHLVACHQRIEERLKTLERIADHWEARPEEALQAAASCVRFLETSGVLHTHDEEDSVFPRMRNRLGAAEQKSLDDLESQHREKEELFGKLRSLIAAFGQAGSPEERARLNKDYRDLVAAFSGLYRTHIAFEDTELIAMARGVLEETELKEISREMRERRSLAS
jgi:hemerythrin-like domain-containing protein